MSYAGLLMGSSLNTPALVHFPPRDTLVFQGGLCLPSVRESLHRSWAVPHHHLVALREAEEVGGTVGNRDCRSSRRELDVGILKIFSRRLRLSTQACPLTWHYPLFLTAIADDRRDFL